MEQQQGVGEEEDQQHGGVHAEDQAPVWSGREVRRWSDGAVVEMEWWMAQMDSGAGGAPPRRPGRDDGQWWKKW